MSDRLNVTVSGPNNARIRVGRNHEHYAEVADIVYYEFRDQEIADRHTFGAVSLDAAKQLIAGLQAIVADVEANQPRQQTVGEVVDALAPGTLFHVDGDTGNHRLLRTTLGVRNAITGETIPSLGRGGYHYTWPHGDVYTVVVDSEGPRT